MQLKKIYLKIIVLTLFSATSIPAFAQVTAKNQSAKEAGIKKLLRTKQYVFVAQSAQPMAGQTIQLNGWYDVSVNKDSLQSFLPYYGRAYTAPMGNTGSPLDFSSVKFTYTAAVNKKGMNNITIKFYDVNDPRQFNLSVTEDGSAVLSVMSINRQPITFFGYITEKKIKKKKAA